MTPISSRVMNLAHIVEQNARRHPTLPALIWGHRRWTWPELDRRVAALAAALRARGIGPGDRVLIQSRNCNQMFEAMWAVFRIGAIWVPSNFRQTPAEFAYCAEISSATAMILQSEFAEHAAAAAIPLAFSIGPAPFGPEIGDDLEPLAQQNHTAPLADVEHHTPCWLFFTSGTTGRPKAAVLTHGQLAFVIQNHLIDLMPGLMPGDASLVVAPLSHGAGMHQLAVTARAGTTVLLEADRFDPAEAWSLIERHRVTNLFTVPTIVKLLTEHESAHRFDHASLRYLIYAGAPMYREDQKHALRTLGPVLVQYFGLGEVTGAITVHPPALHTLDDGPLDGTCGYERTGMHVQIQDEAGQELPPGQTGEICVCGPAVFAGYWQNPDANAKSFRHGWFRTGDLGHMDAQGWVFITGRQSDMYISGGSNVYPREIEEKILQHPAIAEVAILGMPDRQWGEVGVAVCVLHPGASLDEPALLTWLDGRVTRYKLPRRVVFWPALPRSAYGKITKKQIRAELEARNSLPPLPPGEGRGEGNNKNRP